MSQESVRPLRPGAHAPSPAEPRSLDAPESLVPVERCGLCGERSRRRQFAQPPFEVVRCGGCGLVYVTPRLRPELLHRVYDEGYWRSESPSERGYGDYAADAELYRRTFRQRLHFVEALAGGPGRALDVGCAAGFFVETLLERGWDAHGLEPSEAIAGVARSSCGAERIHVGTLEEAPYPDGHFDLVTLWDVVEHVPDPVALLARAGRLLREDGLLVLETQNRASLFARLLGPRWQHYKHLEHLYHFEPSTLPHLLGPAGLELVRRTWRHAGKHVSFAFVRERAGRVHPLLSRALAPFAALDRRSAYVNLGDEMIVVARRARGA